MDRIAIISDIHGNLTALHAVLDDIRSRGIVRMICLGDLIGKGPRPAECTDLVLECCEAVVKGNWDHLATNWKDRTFMRWHRDQLGPDRIDRLFSLPIYLEFRMSGRLVRLCHASPHDLFHRVYIHSDMQDRIQLFAPTPSLDETADVLGYGDIHGAYVDHLQGDLKGKMIFNAGSVGNPLEIPQSSYAIMEGNDGALKPAAFSVSLVRIPYDIEEEIRIAEASTMPHLDEYIAELRTGRYHTRDFH